MSTIYTSKGVVHRKCCCLVSPYTEPKDLLHAGLAGLVNATLIGIVLLCLTPVFRHMPLNALAAIVITGVIGLLDFPRVIFLLKASIPI